MEVYIQQLDSKLTKEQLHERLKSILLRFDVEIFETRKPHGRTFGFLTIADLSKAQKFLSSTNANPSILFSPSGRPAKFQLSSKAPKQNVLRLLQRQEKDSQIRIVSRQMGRANGDAQTATTSNEAGLALSCLECGNWEGKQFVPFWTYRVPGTLRKKSKALVISIGSEPRFEAVMDLLHIDSLAISTVGNLRAVIITLTLAPKIFECPRDGDSDDLSSIFNLLSFAKKPMSHRDTKFPSSDQATIGSCLVYRLTLVPDLQHNGLKRRLQSYTSRQIPVERIPGPPNPVPPLEFQDHVSPLTAALHASESAFAVRFQIQALYTNGTMSPYQVSRLLPALLSRYSKSSEGKLVSLLRRLTLQLDLADRHSRTAEDALAIIRQQENSLLGEDRHLTTPSKSRRDEISVHRIVISPTGIYLYGPDEVPLNRVLRKHRMHNDCFLRIAFGEEDETRIEFNRDVSNERILRGRFLQILDGGLDIAGEHFDFLGFSHSSLRSQACWFMRPFYQDGVKIDARSLINALGDFSSFRCPAKCAARIGQAFSESQSAISIDPSVVREIPDIESGRHVFTDGCGTISMALWKLLRGPTSARNQPTLYQIRYKGAKGMISLDTRLPGKQLCLRPSMIKFDGSPSNDIEICGSNAKALPFKLNRQLIKILEDLGVEAEVFEDLQAKAIDNLRRSATSVSTAIEFLTSQLSDSASGLPTLLPALLTQSIDVTEDAFLRDILGALLQVQLREMKYRSRILVPDALTLYGICDETGCLGEGEVFVTFAADRPKDQHHIVGTVAVTRSPALHPGDVQLVRAVSPPPSSCLWSLTNSIVFSSKGSRDLPSMLSGGDLDGDLYHIIYDQNLLPKRTDSPAQYLPVQPLELDHPVKVTDMTKFFVDFMQNDQLGRIATLHQVFADNELGTRSPECLLLAELHSTAVDFSKSGVMVNVARIPKSPPKRPDFMAPSASIPVEKENKRPEDIPVAASDETHRFRYYRSQRVLGRLYRAIDEDVFFNDLEEDTSSLFSHEATENVLEEIWRFVENQTQGANWQRYMKLAQEVRDHYEYNILDVMTQYATAGTSYLTEKEVLIGTIIGRSGSSSRFQREQSDFLKSRFNRDLRAIREWMEDKMGGDDFEFQCLAVACLYVAVKQPSNMTAGRHGPPLRSFGWYAAGLCVPDLVEVKREPQPSRHGGITY